MKKSLLFLSLVLAMILPHGEAFALTISPPRIEIAADVGSSVQSDILLINDEQESKTFYITFENFEAQGETGTPRFIGARDGLATWLSAPSTVTLAPGESKKVPFTIQIPSDAQEAGYFSVVFFGTNPPDEGQGSQVSVGAKVGTLVFLTVGTNISESAGLVNFGVANKKFFHKSLPVLFDYRFVNNGGDRIQPEGSITIRSILGWKVAKIDANPFEGNILPKTTRRFTPEWTKLAPDDRPAAAPKEKYSFKRELSEQWDNFAIGIFRAKMELVYGSTEQVAESKGAYFVVLPLELMLISFIILFILYIVLRKGIRRYNRFIIAQSQLSRGE